MTIIRSGKFVNVSIDTGDLEFIYSGLRDQATACRNATVGDGFGFDTEEDREEAAKHNEWLADYLEAIAVYHY